MFLRVYLNKIFKQEREYFIMFKKPKLRKLVRTLCLGGLLIAYGYGAGRARTSSVGIKHWNPLEIYKVWTARGFEKHLAKRES